MTKKEFFELLERYEKGQASDEDKKLFDRFFNAFQEGTWKDWELSPKEQIRLDIYSNLKKGIDQSSGASGSKGVFLLKIAASLALIITLGYLGYTILRGPSSAVMITKTVPMGERAKINLSDGSLVHLNSGSSITYPEKFDEGSRNVSLSGEAYFEVRHNKKNPFVVSAGRLQVAVLGTTFNIAAHDPEQTSVTLIEGKVSVSAESERQILNPGEQVRFDTKTNALIRSTINTDGETSWMNGILYFKETPLTEVMAELGRWYNTEIMLSDTVLKDCTITGTFKEEKLVDVLEGIRFLTDITYQIMDTGKVVVEGEGCTP